MWQLQAREPRPPCFIQIRGQLRRSQRMACREQLVLEFAPLHQRALDRWSTLTLESFLGSPARVLKKVSVCSRDMASSAELISAARREAAAVSHDARRPDTEPAGEVRLGQRHGSDLHTEQRGQRLFLIGGGVLNEKVERLRTRGLSGIGTRPYTPLHRDAASAGPLLRQLRPVEQCRLSPAARGAGPLQEIRADSR